jgi:hypothetical protein
VSPHTSVECVTNPIQYPERTAFPLVVVADGQMASGAQCGALYRLDRLRFLTQELKAADTNVPG